MVYRRKRNYAKKKTYRKRKAKMGTSLLSNFTSGNLHNFKRVEFLSNQEITTDTLVQPNPGFAGLGFDFALRQITDHLNLTKIFDCYRILRVKIKITPVRNSFAAPNFMPQVCMARDFDDADAPVNAERMLCRSKSYLAPFSRSISMTIRPNISSEVYQTAVSSGYKQTTGWLDCVDANVPHYGVKVGFVASPGQTITFHTQTEYTLGFKQPVVPATP